ncbi:hypothetical protein PAB09_03035 [Corynebacterium sp. SCR221107]|uniref:hypothetical protein n=1 Tax=Corynebacterium sp. SCR221107 TaxID=3017361 RepID=UPI0022EC6C82|nr:hypothetical protein [Corynebacterium sp. SCR221107]WBT09321.1 hypothetical protein PAB09_03035 [Corynebacterium sp. SCR221107]
MNVNLGPDEYVLVDVTSSLASLTYPVVQLTLITGVAWMGIGFIDQPQPEVIVDTGMRNIFVGVWALLVLWRFVLPVIKARRQRLILTNKRLILRAPGLRGYSDSIPLHAIRQVMRRGKSLHLAIRGYDRPITINDVPRARKVAEIIDSSIVRAIW